MQDLRSMGFKMKVRSVKISRVCPNSSISWIGSKIIHWEPPLYHCGHVFVGHAEL